MLPAASILCYMSHVKLSSVARTGLNAMAGSDKVGPNRPLYPAWQSARSPYMQIYRPPAASRCLPSKSWPSPAESAPHAAPAEMPLADHIPQAPHTARNADILLCLHATAEPRTNVFLPRSTCQCVSLDHSDTSFPKYVRTASLSQECLEITVNIVTIQHAKHCPRPASGKLRFGA